MKTWQDTYDIQTDVGAVSLGVLIEETVYICNISSVVGWGCVTCDNYTGQVMGMMEEEVTGATRGLLRELG